MKKIEAVVQPDMLEPVIKALRKVGVGGFSVLEAKGQGSAEPPLVGQFFSKNNAAPKSTKYKPELKVSGPAL